VELETGNAAVQIGRMSSQEGETVYLLVLEDASTAEEPGEGTGKALEASR